MDTESTENSLTITTGDQTVSPNQAPEMDCYGDDREALNDFERFYNNSLCSDVSLLVGDEIFYAHKLVLVKNSEVFERMLSQQWSGERKVCIDYAISYIIPVLSLKDVFHVWFQYGTKCVHQQLISHCVALLSNSFQELISSAEWEKEWLSLDREQLTEFLKSSEIYVSSEYDLWLAVLKWLQAPPHPERRGSASEKNLSHLIPLIRFPLMTADELYQVERCQLVEQHAKLFGPQLLLAFKYQALPLSSRVANRDFSGNQFLLRNYIELRWDKRLVVSDIIGIPRFTEVSLKVATKASTFPAQSWDWELKIHPKGFSGSCEDFRTTLVSNVILDQTRAVEYLLSIVDDKKVLRSVAGKKIFTKSRYNVDLEMEKKVSVDEITSESSPLLVNNNLYLQLTLRPID